MHLCSVRFCLLFSVSVSVSVLLLCFSPLILTSWVGAKHLLLQNIQILIGASTLIHECMYAIVLMFLCS